MKQDIPIFIGHDSSTVEATLACTGDRKSVV